ncbi:hypothetical protein LINGRAHAP2_LOCUS14646 [Linum grandiflorum]
MAPLGFPNPGTTQGGTSSSSSSDTTTLLLQMMENQQASIINLENQVAALTKALTVRPPGTLPGNTEENTKGNLEHCKVITTRSGKQINPIPPVVKPPILVPPKLIPKDDELVEDVIEDEKDEELAEEAEGAEKESVEASASHKRKAAETDDDLKLDTKSADKLDLDRCKPKALYPNCLTADLRRKSFLKFCARLRGMQFTLPFTEAIFKMPEYAKFLKEIFTNKRKLTEVANVTLNEHYSAIVSTYIPKKLKDPEETDDEEVKLLDSPTTNSPNPPSNGAFIDETNAAAKPSKKRLNGRQRKRRRLELKLGEKIKKKMSKMNCFGSKSTPSIPAGCAEFTHPNLGSILVTIDSTNYWCIISYLRRHFMCSYRPFPM